MGPASGLAVAAPQPAPQLRPPSRPRSCGPPAGPAAAARPAPTLRPAAGAAMVAHVRAPSLLAPRVTTPGGAIQGHSPTPTKFTSRFFSVLKDPGVATHRSSTANAFIPPGGI